MAQGNPYTAYHRTSVETADQRQLILMLYDGSIRFMRQAVTRIESKDMEAAHNYLIRARDIVTELLSTLKPEKAGEVGENLKNLYAYMFNRLVEANLKKDREAVREVIGLMSTLREGWAHAKSGTHAPRQEPKAVAAAGGEAGGKGRVNLRG